MYGEMDDAVFCYECDGCDEHEPDCPNYDPTEYEDFDDDLDRDFDDRSMFADPGGRSALRAASADNPRNLPCPSCDRPNQLTPADVDRGYQCDSCADAAERGF